MNRSLSRPVVVIITVLAILVLGSAVTAQTDRALVVAPCQEQGVPSKPTLKQRQPKPDDSTPKENSVTPPAVERANCGPAGENQSPENENKVTIKFEGLVNVSELDLLKHLREHQIRLPRDPNLELVDQASNAIKQFLVARGYLHAIVAARTEQMNDDARAIIFVVNEGVRPRIAEFRFEGNRIFPSQQLAEQARQCMVRFERDFYDSEVFEYCIHRLDNFARGQGYLQARFHDQKVAETEAGLIVTLQVDERVLYRLGEVKIEGSLFLSPDQILAMSPLHKGEIVNGELLSRWLYETMKQVYGENGYIQYTAEITPKFNLTPDKSEGVVDIELTIDEGPRYRLSKVSFKGNTEISDRELRRLLVIRVGDIYNQRLFEESITKLNESGLFDPIDKDRDADFRTNEEEHCVEVVIKLTKRQT
jgi:outer membrane protein assembly factor BamA